MSRAHTRTRGVHLSFVLAALLLATVLLLGGLLPEPSVRLAAVGGGAVPAHTTASLVRPPGCLAIAPACTVLDQLSLLTLDQHVAVLLSLAALWLGVRRIRRRARRKAGMPPRRRRTELAGAALGLVLFVGVYAVGALADRPMARLTLADPDAVIVDFHSHTDHSHDGRPAFDVERRRAWHAAAGFHAAYLSDHRTWTAWQEGAARNPRRAAEGTTLLPALELRVAGKHANMLGAPERYERAIDDDPVDWDRVLEATPPQAPDPTLVLVLPAHLEGAPAHRSRQAPGFVALELVDASPRGLAQSRRRRGELLHAARSLDLALVAGSNHHGWGRTAAAWTVLRIPGWRDLDAEGLDAAIQRELHGKRFGATHVLERTAVTTVGATLPLTLPALVWHTSATLAPGERAAALGYLTLMVFSASFFGRARRGVPVRRPV